MSCPQLVATVGGGLKHGFVLPLPREMIQLSRIVQVSAEAVRMLKLISMFFSLPGKSPFISPFTIYLWSFNILEVCTWHPRSLQGILEQFPPRRSPTWQEKTLGPLKGSEPMPLSGFDSPGKPSKGGSFAKVFLRGEQHISPAGATFQAVL